MAVRRMVAAGSLAAAVPGILAEVPPAGSSAVPGITAEVLPVLAEGLPADMDQDLAGRLLY